MARNKEKWNAYMREYQAKNLDKRRDSVLRNNYGITLADYDAMLEAQDGGCAICGMTPEDNGRRLDVDHDHKTDAVRGLLCARCNLGLGYFLDSPETLEAAQRYLYIHGK